MSYRPIRRARNAAPSPGPAQQTEADGAVHAHDSPPPFATGPVVARGAGRGPRRRGDRRAHPLGGQRRARLGRRGRRPGPEGRRALAAVDEQVHEAEVTVAVSSRPPPRPPPPRPPRPTRRVDAYEPQLRAIAQSGYTGKSQSRFAAFLTSASAAELVQQMTTLDMIAAHTNAVDRRRRRRPGRGREQAQAAADQAAATRRRPGSSSCRPSRPRCRSRSTDYQADFARLSAAEQAR